jgi:hypothetical protein
MRGAEDESGGTLFAMRVAGVDARRLLAAVAKLAVRTTCFAAALSAVSLHLTVQASSAHLAVIASLPVLTDRAAAAVNAGVAMPVVRLTKVAAAAVSAAAARLAVPTVRILAHGDAMGPGSRQIEVMVLPSKKKYFRPLRFYYLLATWYACGEGGWVVPSPIVGALTALAERSLPSNAGGRPPPPARE